MEFNFQTQLSNNHNEQNNELQNNFELNSAQNNNLILKQDPKQGFPQSHDDFSNNAKNFKDNNDIFPEKTTENQQTDNQNNNIINENVNTNINDNDYNNNKNNNNTNDGVNNNNSESEDFESSKRYRQKRVLKVWTTEEDELLVKYHKEYNGKWEQIAQLIKDRNASQCAQRYRRLNPTRIRSHWTPQEDEIVKKMVKKFGKNWGLLANNLEGRNGKQVRERYLNCLDPDIDWDPFDKTEDTIIWLYYKKIGPKWSEISKLLQGRPENMIKNRYYAHLKRIMNDNPKKVSQMDKLSLDESQKQVLEYYAQKSKTKSINQKQKQEYIDNGDDDTSIQIPTKNQKRRHKQNKMGVSDISNSDGSSDSDSSSIMNKKKKKNKKNKKNKKSANDEEMNSEEFKQHKKKKAKELNLKIDHNDDIVGQYAYPYIISSPYPQLIQRQSSLTPSQQIKFFNPQMNNCYQILTPGPQTSLQNQNIRYQTVQIDGSNYYVPTSNMQQLYSLTSQQQQQQFNFNQIQNTPLKFEGNEFFGNTNYLNEHGNALKQKQPEFMVLPIQSCQKKENEQAFSFNNTEQAIQSQKNDSPVQSVNGNYEGKFTNAQQLNLNNANQNQNTANENGPTLAQQPSNPTFNNTQQYLQMGKNPIMNQYDEQFFTPNPQQRKDGFFPGQFNFKTGDLANYLGNNGFTPLQTCGSQKNNFTFELEQTDQATPDLNYQQSNSFAFPSYIQSKSPQIQRPQLQQQQQNNQNLNINSSFNNLNIIKQQQQQNQLHQDENIQNFSSLNNLNNINSNQNQNSINLIGNNVNQNNQASKQNSQQNSHTQLQNSQKNGGLQEIKEQQDNISIKSSGSRKPNLALDINKIQNWGNQQQQQDINNINQLQQLQQMQIQQQNSNQQPKQEFIDEDEQIKQIQSQMDFLQQKLKQAQERKNAKKN